ncbi:hypothetical protein IOC57_06440 [Bacillus sp. SD075]|uniref:hypothetical protein n=1 Tax=Bacillus sp. SD075 TaxID=2781732 RepID=UPI001A9672D0|nr:hypothetical protein [Bacillus sp. SD075]MBO0997390.1 hypothetical protein [Bacillus sp. SD075]
MKVQVICEVCNKLVELVPLTNGQHADIGKIESDFRIQEIELDMDYNVDEIDEVTAEVKELRIDCNSCGNYIVLNEFPTHVYR